ncbi:MAG: hypothetical protein H3C34_19905 [Caldilineaceae bacterium]|nr:hypothetical protein [Caldilineaceae bacterium]
MTQWIRLLIVFCLCLVLLLVAGQGAIAGAKWFSSTSGIQQGVGRVCTNAIELIAISNRVERWTFVLAHAESGQPLGQTTVVTARAIQNPNNEPGAYFFGYPTVYYGAVVWPFPAPLPAGAIVKVGSDLSADHVEVAVEGCTVRGR